MSNTTDIKHLQDNYRVAATEYSTAFKKMRRLDAVDNANLWKAVSVKFPKYQILPDTNHVAYIKNNILASIYTVGRCASLLPTCADDNDIIQNLNNALEHIWIQLNVPMYQMQAGERAALLNLGITQIGWDNSITNARPFTKGEVKLKNINPLHYMRDPFSETLDDAAYVITWDEYHKSTLLANPSYTEAFKKYLNTKGTSGDYNGTTPSRIQDKITDESSSKSDYFKVYIHWVRQDGKINEIHTIDNKYILCEKLDIQPRVFPFAELYCNLPNGNLVGSSECSKIFANSLAYNILNSMGLTAEYKNQRPPRFVNTQSGLNVASFAKQGNDADRVFPVNGDATRAVHYHQFPTLSSSAFSAMGSLTNDIHSVTGVDGRYTGRDTGSILTTGGIENMLAQVTLIDAPKITMYENYCKRMSQLIISNYIINSTLSRSYLLKNKATQKSMEIEVDFPKIPDDIVFEYDLQISPYLPKNKANLASMANKLMEMQMQYSNAGLETDLITPQEWLQFQDFPLKEYMSERMNIQRTQNWQDAVAEIIGHYTELVSQGAPPEQALDATALAMKSKSDTGEVDPNQVMQEMSNMY